MAEAALLGLANSVLGQLSAPALKEFLLVWNSKKDLQRLQETIQTLTAFLRDAEQKEATNDLVKEWLSRLKEVLYEADDLFDSASYMALHKKTMSGNSFKKEVHLFFSKSNQLGFAFKSAHDVKAIRERLDGIKDDMSQLNFTSMKSFEVEEKIVTVRLRSREETHSFIKVEDVIGRDREIDEIINLLLSEDNSRGEDQSLSVISVIGFGGLGKTTLAQSVYNHERVQGSFDMYLWVCINYLSDLKQVLVEILTSFLKKKPEETNLDQLQQKLRESIGGKKYLLVLDDVWDENESNWPQLEHLLSCGKNGSKVLATTRSTKVAQCLDSIKPYYELSVLSEESAWELFVKMAFKEGGLSNSDPGLVLLGKQIVQKCGCLPLALVSIGRTLRYRTKEIKSWKSFVEKELPEVLLGGDVNNVKLMEVLKVSYNNLPPTLKHCFAYCSLFPKDYRFDKDQLVRLWIAQGFVVPHGKKSLEEVGDDCFFHMVDGCFFQEVEMYSEEGCLEYTCKMHDLLHDLAMQVAGNECCYVVEKDLENIGDKIAHRRHISLNCNPNLLLDYSSMSSQSKMLRTLMFFDIMNLKAKCFDSFFASFELLRVLKLSDLGLEKLPDSIGELIHLRYLDLSRNRELKFLPNSICKLHHLQTLILKGCERLKELPSNIEKLVSLRHLFLNHSSALDTCRSRLAALTALVTLDPLIVHHHDRGLRYLAELDNLCGMLSIKLPREGWSNCIEDARDACMFRKHNINGMSIDWETDKEGEVEEEAVAKAVLEQLKPTENLKYLKITRYGGDMLSNWFSSLPNLKELVLEDCSLEYMEDVSCVRSGGSNLFPCLETLYMSNLLNLKGWWRELRHNASLLVLPRVSKVFIDNCPNLMESMPLFGKEIEELSLVEVNGKLVSKLLDTSNMSCSSACQHYTKLQVLTLCGIKDLECLAEGLIRHLIALKSLDIACCDELSWVSSSGLANLNSLEELQMTLACGNVRLEDKYDKKQSQIRPWTALRRLRKLSVPWQRNLVQEGLQYLTSLEELFIRYYEANQVEADNEDMEGRGLVQKLGSLERLQSLCIGFSRIRCGFPKWIQCLRFVKKLKLHDCEELTSMSWRSLANLKNLRMLSLHGIENVSSSVDDLVVEQPTQFNSLVKLEIQGFRTNQIQDECEESSSMDREFEENLQNQIHDIPWKLLPSLRFLRLSGIEKLRSIPDGIQQLTSLQELTLYGCKEIERIPNWMINLTSLQQLTIYPCSPELEARCKRETGVDWHLISHIRIIYITEY